MSKNSIICTVLKIHLYNNLIRSKIVIDCKRIFLEDNTTVNTTVYSIALIILKSDCFVVSS